MPAPLHRRLRSWLRPLTVSRAGSEILGLIAGEGALPLEVARSAREAGRRVAAVAFRGHTDPRIDEDAEVVRWLHPGELGALVEALRSAGVRDAVMAGKVPKADLYDDAEASHLDEDAMRLIAGLSDLRDDSILGAVADYLEARGVRLLPQARLVPALLVGEGPLGRTRATPEQLADVAFGWPLAKSIAELDIGQTLVVKEQQYVEAARTIGATPQRIMAQHILPQLAAPLLVLASVLIGATIVTEAALSFLGLGANSPENPTWGFMLFEAVARPPMAKFYWMSMAPGIAITLTVLSFNLLGDALRDIFDPRLRGTGAGA